MKAKTPTQRIYDLRVKLEALATRGVNGEATAAKEKLARLLKRYDFTKPYVRVEDIFAGKFQPASEAVHVWKYEPEDRDIGEFVKWAITGQTKIGGVFRDNALYLQAAPSSAIRLGEVVGNISENFRQLWRQFRAVPGANPADRGNFLAGLYDGMLDEIRSGQSLPSRPGHNGKVKGKRKALGHVAGIGLHPYSVATALGKQIRFSVPLETIAGELEAKIKGEIGS